MLEGMPGFLALGALGAPPAVVACAFAAITIHLMYQHGNIEYRLGPLRHIFAVAEVHRWHHQRRWHDVQGNYSGVLALWDQVFGSVLPQRGDAPLDVGMDDEPDLPSDWLGQIRWPFRRRARTGRAAVSQRFMPQRPAERCCACFASSSRSAACCLGSGWKTTRTPPSMSSATA